MKGLPWSRLKTVPTRRQHQHHQLQGNNVLKKNVRGRGAGLAWRAICLLASGFTRGDIQQDTLVSLHPHGFFSERRQLETCLSMKGNKAHVALARVSLLRVPPVCSWPPRVLQGQVPPWGARCLLGCKTGKSALSSNPKPQQLTNPRSLVIKTLLSPVGSLWLGSEFKQGKEPSLTATSLCYECLTISLLFPSCCHYVSL